MTPKTPNQTNGRSIQMPTNEPFVELMLDNLESEWRAGLSRLHYVQTVLLQHGRISRKALINREEDRQ